VSEKPAAIVPPVIPPVAKKDKPALVVGEEASEAAASAPKAAEPVATGVSAEAPAPPETPKATHRDLLRAKMEVTDFNAVWPAIREKVNSLEGKVIGTIELGSQRKKGEAYFHFSLPESKQKEFEDYLKTFGPVRFVKQADKREMQEGENHIILTVKDVSPNEERKETEAP